MTNEMLAQFIQEGGNDELIPILWEKVRKLLYVKADRFYSLYKSACDGSGVDVWDITSGELQRIPGRCKGIQSRR